MANVEGIVIEEINRFIEPGLTVYDDAGKKVGLVDSVDRDTGWFVVGTSEFSGKEIYVPYSLITSIDKRELFLSRSKDELLANYANPPARSTLVADEAGEETAITSESSGYDGTPVVVDRVRIDEIKTEIVAGSHVYTTDMVDLGTIKQYDSATGTMVVEKGLFSKRDLVVPVTVVDYVDEDTREVYLACSQADLGRMQHREPVHVVMAPAEVKESK